jgi:hypothetical protein
MDSIAKGSASVFIGGKAAARQTDTTVHGGLISKGAARTFIGDGKGAPGKQKPCMQSASVSGQAIIAGEPGGAVIFT